MKSRNNFITLTKVCRFGQAMSDKTITVNIDNILYFESSVDDDGSLVYFRGSDPVLVDESFDYISQVITGRVRLPQSQI